MALHQNSERARASAKTQPRVAVDEVAAAIVEVTIGQANVLVLINLNLEDIDLGLDPRQEPISPRSQIEKATANTTADVTTQVDHDQALHTNSSI